ncbi:MAG TPA: acyl-CoA dehydrogenase family protein, partial [Solirubrobacteraceae bacterium]|nr:acyl-CoA dehydrogenase family protein [Solirubrobacteraceae bacterium]
MRFAFNDDQRLLAASVRDYLAKECTPDVVRAVWDTPAAGDDMWRGLAELGIVGATVPEQHGGLGLDAVDVILAAEEAGRAALPLPLGETVLVAGPLLIELGEHLGDEWLPRLASGEARVAVGLPDVDPLIAYAGSAELVAIVAEDSVVVARPEDLALRSAPTIDGGRPTWTVAPGTGQRVEAPPDIAANALDRGVLAAAAELTGVGLRMI